MMKVDCRNTGKGARLRNYLVFCRRLRGPRACDCRGPGDGGAVRFISPGLKSLFALCPLKSAPVFQK